MKPSRGNVARLAVLAGPVAALLIGGAAFAQEQRDPEGVGTTCLAVDAERLIRIELPCPKGLDALLERLQPAGEPTHRRDIVIDPDWPHDQAMVAGRDWRHDQAMVVPRSDEKKDIAPRIEDLLGLFGGHLSRDLRRQPPATLQPRRAGYAGPSD